MARGYSTTLFQIDRSSGIPKQTQIREYFVRAILNRSMAAGEALPSTRQLSEQLGVSRNTVILAYQALTDGGYINPVSRSGLLSALMRRFLWRWKAVPCRVRKIASTGARN